MSIVVPPVYMKFQPMPSRTRAAQNCQIALPDRATPMQATMKAIPTAMILIAPKRLISEPVANPGAYIPTTCHSITSAAALKGWLQKLIASGVAVISRFMMP